MKTNLSNNYLETFISYIIVGKKYINKSIFSNWVFKIINKEEFDLYY